MMSDLYREDNIRDSKKHIADFILINFYSHRLSNTMMVQNITGQDSQGISILYNSCNFLL